MMRPIQLRSAMRAAFFDVDGTLTKVRVWQGLMDYFKINGGRRVTNMAFWSYHLPAYFLYRFGIISQTSFRKPWGRHLPWYLRGKTVAEARDIGDWVAEEFLADYWWDDALDLVSEHLNNEDAVIIVSGGPKPITERIAKKLGISHVVGTTLRVENGIYTGGVSGELCLAENKASMAVEYIQNVGLDINLAESFAYADSPGDVHLLEMVGNPVATHPDEELREIAAARGWEIFPQ